MPVGFLEGFSAGDRRYCTFVVTFDVPIPTRPGRLPLLASASVNKEGRACD